MIKLSGHILKPCLVYYTYSHIINYIVVINCNLDYFISEALYELYMKMRIQSLHRKLIASISTQCGLQIYMMLSRSWGEGRGVNSDMKIMEILELNP